MKNLAMAFVAVWPAIALSAEAGPPDGVLEECAGEVWRLPLDGETWAPAAAGTPLSVGDSIRTGRKSRARIRLGANIELRLGSSTELQIEEPEAEEQPVPAVSLMLGWLQAAVSHAPGEEVPFEVHTGNAVAGVRGTEFVVAAGLDGVTRTAVLSGRVAFAGEDAEVMVEPGQASEAAEGVAPAPPAASRTADWEAWQEEREGRARERAEEIAANFVNRAQELTVRLRELREAEARQRQKIRWVVEKLGQARRANQEKLVAKARERLLDLWADEMRLRREMRRAAVRLVASVRRLQGLQEALAAGGGDKLEEALAAHPRLANALRWLKGKDTGEKALDRMRAFERLRREVLRDMRALRAIAKNAGFSRADLREARERVRRLRDARRP